MRHYNDTKGGNDCFDKLCRTYITSRRTSRWPMRFFFGMLDHAAVNSRILVKCKAVLSGQEERIAAKFCLKMLYSSLVIPLLQERYTYPSIRLSLKFTIAEVLQRERMQHAGSAKEWKIKRRSKLALFASVRCAMSTGPTLVSAVRARLTPLINITKTWFYYVKKLNDLYLIIIHHGLL